jgi:hypothetical protein
MVRNILLLQCINNMDFNFIIYYIKQLFTNNRYLLSYILFVLKINKLEYYHRNNNCTTQSSKDKNCICWYMVGKGPFEEIKIYFNKENRFKPQVVTISRFNQLSLSLRYRNIITKKVTRINYE